MPARDFLHFAIVAMNEKTREEIYQQWLAILPLMIMKVIKYISFEQFNEDAIGANIDRRPVEVILAEIDKAEAELHGESNESV